MLCFADTPGFLSIFCKIPVHQSFRLCVHPLVCPSDLQICPSDSYLSVQSVGLSLQLPICRPDPSILRQCNGPIWLIHRLGEVWISLHCSEVSSKPKNERTSERTGERTSKGTSRGRAFVESRVLMLRAAVTERWKRGSLIGISGMSLSLVCLCLCL